MPSSITPALLKGHSQPVQDILFTNSKYVTSLSLDHSIRIWDISTQKPTSCILLDKSHTPLSIQYLNENELIYMTTNGKLFTMDLRKMQTIVTPHSQLLSSSTFALFSQNEEQENEISSMNWNSTLEQLAVSDDAGNVSLLERIDGQWKLEMKKESLHSNICSQVKVLHSKNETISTGFDFQLLHHQTSHLFQYNFSKQAQMINAQTMFNPPFVYSMDGNEKWIVCGLGNGQVFVFSKKSNSWEPYNTWNELVSIHDQVTSLIPLRHDYIVSQVQFVKGRRDCFMSCSANGIIMQWKLDSLSQYMKELLQLIKKKKSAKSLLSQIQSWQLQHVNKSINKLETIEMDHFAVCDQQSNYIYLYKMN